MNWETVKTGLAVVGAAAIVFSVLFVLWALLTPDQPDEDGWGGNA